MACFVIQLLDIQNQRGPKKAHTLGGYFKYLGTRRSALLGCKYLTVGGQASCQWEVFAGSAVMYIWPFCPSIRRLKIKHWRVYDLFWSACCPHLLLLVEKLIFVALFNLHVSKTDKCNSVMHTLKWRRNPSLAWAELKNTTPATSPQCNCNSLLCYPAVLLRLLASSVKFDYRIFPLHHVYLATRITRCRPSHWSFQNAPGTNGKAVTMVQCVVAGWNFAARHVSPGIFALRF